LAMHTDPTSVMNGMFRAPFWRWSPWPLLLASALIAIVSALIKRRGLESSGGFWVIPLWMLGSLLLWAILPGGGSAHHLFPLYVLSIVWVGGVLAYPRWGLARSIAMAVVAASTLANAATVVQFHRQLAMDGGQGNWTPSTAALAQLVRQEHQKSFVMLDWGLLYPVYVLADAPTNVRELSWDTASNPAIVENRLQPYLSDPDTVFVLHGENHTVFPEPRRALIQSLDSADPERNCQVFALSNDAEPLIELCSPRQTETASDSSRRMVEQVSNGPHGSHIAATPNPVPATSALTTVSWSTGGDSFGFVYLSVDGNPEALFAQGPAGSAEAPWISPGAAYEFRLYAESDHTNPLARITVRRR